MNKKAQLSALSALSGMRDGRLAATLAGEGVAELLALLARKAHRAHREYVDKSEVARRIPEGSKPVPGRVYYLHHPENRFNVADWKGWPGPVGKAMRWLKGKGWSGQFPLQHSRTLTVDPSGHAVAYGFNYDKPVGNMSKPWVDTFDFGNVSGMDDEELARHVYNYKGNGKGYGSRLSLYSGGEVPDIGVVKRYYDEANRYPNEYSVVPGDQNCGTVARNAFEAARAPAHGQGGHWLDMLWGGFPSANTPSYAKKTTYAAGQDGDGQSSPRKRTNGLAFVR